ncbi:MAG: FAD-dependent oxidoreductase [Methanobacteriota archaeon]|nr:MAG: FAD-dependent oxidoreductase [Euryarchaeota archaeon]
MAKKIVIVGGGCGGGTAAQFARKTDREAEITIIEREPYPQYSRCGLPYGISGIIPELTNLIEAPEERLKRSKIDILLGASVTRVDSGGKSAHVTRADGDEIEMPYDSLVLATGASASVPPVKGAFLEGNGQGPLRPGVFVLRTIEDARGIQSLASKGKRAVVIGAGLVGLEVAEALMIRGCKVTIIEYLSNCILAMVDDDMARMMADAIARDGVKMFTEYEATEILGEDRANCVVANDRKTGEERTFYADVIVFATGQRGETKLAKEIGCKTGPTKQVVVDDRCETRVSGVYAVGDCTEYPDLITGRPAVSGLGTIAVKMAMVAGVNAAGGDERLPKGFLQTRATEPFGCQVAAVGPTAAQLEDAGIHPIIGKVRGYTLPDYFPGRKEIYVKVLAHPKDGRILGAQIVGESRVHLRVNAFVAAIQAGMTAHDFAKLETAYCPPAAPTIDVITIACESVRLKMDRRRPPTEAQ